jgi:LmbE family N-acetylglucosaminyl deacetylase
VSGGIVAVVAHPDDESLIAGGTLALAARAGVATGAVSLTRGEEGPISDPALASRATLPAVREAELSAAGEALGLDWVTCLRHPDGELAWVDHEAAAAELAELLAAFAPAVLLTFGADGLYWHPDHIATAEIAASAAARLVPPADVYAAAWPSGLVAEVVAAAAARGLPHDLWGLEPAAFGAETPATVSVDVRAVLPQKLTALRAHRTQVGRDHLLSALPLELAQRHLGFEPWAGPPDGRLAALLADG